MKNYIITVLHIVALSFMIACSSDDDDSITFDTIDGSWSLRNVRGGLAGLNVDYNPGEVVWEFNETTGIVLVSNLIDSTGPEDIYARLETGTYNFRIDVENDTDVLYINNSKMGNISIDGSQLLIDDGFAADGLIMEFVGRLVF